MADRDEGPLAPHLRSAAPEDRPGEGRSQPESATAPAVSGPPSATSTASAAGPASATNTASATSTASAAGPADAARPAVPAEVAGPSAGTIRVLARRTWRGTTSAGRGVRTWSRRPSGQLAVPALLLAGLIAAAGAAGAVVVPAVAGSSNQEPVDTAAPDVSAEPSAQPVPTGPAATAAPVTPPVVPTGLATAPIGPSATAPGLPGRPADVLAGWAQQVGDRAGVPPIAMQAYGYAELVLAQTNPGCHLSWTTLAAIGSVESNHGRANGAALAPDGQAFPPIIGLPLDGQGGRQRIPDTDRGQLDGDPVLDRAVGPMQFIPSTWARAGVDADSDGATNPHDIDDAALAAANYLCANGRDLTTPRDWWAAILSYNAVRPYAQAVFDTANRYGTSSRT